ncbi:helix-turn-helix transcriptional regulator [Listeria grandensis]|uniref:helix-turn-helix domain-containing protein n=1 Tax=Listeria grandensis TaxID=1494963 RepID=UPI0016252F88|nr:helix-turn-helix transcriptional regulator [Listeria grandensis]MBC1474949.1 helix-turn-helix transcriptional regulator [Listeria grandensis]
MYERIKEIAKENNISIYSIEKKCELSSGSICKWNNSEPRTSSLLKVCKCLGIDINELLEEEK